MNLQEQIDGEAVPFIMIRERVEGEQVKFQFQLTQQATEIFNNIKNKKIAIASIAGPQRTGKSFLSNRLLKRMTGFAIGPTTMPCTKGLWIWGKPLEIDSDSVLIIMDTEGLNSVQRDINIDLKIFALSILLSSVFIYNSIGHIDEKALQNMSYVLKISQNLKVTKNNVEKQSEMSQYFPYFYWVLRDFTLDLQGKTQSEYLEDSLKPISGDKNNPKNQIRAKIRKLFLHRRCECFPRPVDNEKQLAHIEKLQYKDLREKFRIKIQNFEKTFYETLPMKTIKGKPVTGGIYLNLIREYIEAMNTGKVPEILTSLERVLESEARTIMEEMTKKYNEAMSKVFKGDSPIDEYFLERNHRDFLRQIELKMQDKFKNWSDIGKTNDYRIKLADNLDAGFKERLKRNSQMSQALCASEFNKFFNDFNFEELSSLSDYEQNYNLVREKFEQFTRKIKPYFQKCKNPRKFTYFVEKFPKRIFDFFDLLLSRVSGFYNEELIRLKAEVKNYQGEVDSVKRIMKQQQNLINEKQNFVSVIQNENDNYRREIEKIEKLKEFEKETEKMNKGQLKEDLKLYKTQVVELEQRVEELESEISKLKQSSHNGTSLKRFDASNFMKDPSQATGDTDGMSSHRSLNDLDCPNEVVSNLTGLKKKLGLMLNFYEQKLTDESLNVDENILAQLDRLRAEKHEALEKIRSEYRAKEEKARQQKKKDREHYEKTIEVLNKHLDDIKNENIELQERLNSKPSESQHRNVNQERKRFEESLKLKQNNITSLNLLNKEIQKKLEEKEQLYAEIEGEMAMLKAEKANFESYKETFAFILRESINWVMNKNNKLKHSVKTLNQEDLLTIKAVFKELDLHPF